MLRNNEEPFSKRHGYKSLKVDISIRNEATSEFRMALIQIPKQLELKYNEIREIICSVLLKTPDPDNWSETPNVRDECVELINECEWFKVYDIAEYMYKYLCENIPYLSSKFQSNLNDFFIERGYGWKVENGLIIARGEETFETHIKEVEEVLMANGLSTAKREIKEAINDISKRPDPDITGAVQHSLAGLECVCREITGDKKSTLGKIIDDNPDLIPKPLDKALDKIWGFSSEMGRHLKEGKMPKFEEAKLLVDLCSVLIIYLLQKR